MNRDFESPIQDADIEAMELTAQANRESRLARKGICTHGWIGPVVKPWEQGAVRDRRYVCHNCGRVFESEGALNADRRKALGEEA